MAIIVVFPRGGYGSESNGAEKSHKIRIRTPLGDQVKVGRVWVIPSTRAASCSIAVDVRHGPLVDLDAFIAYQSGVISEGAASQSTIPVTGALDVEANGPVGTYLEIVLKVTGNSGSYGVFDGTVLLEHYAY